MSWVKNKFGESVYKSISSLASDVVANEELHKQRYDICSNCDKLSSIKFCSECGCYMPVKTKFKIFKCPLNKW